MFLYHTFLLSFENMHVNNQHERIIVLLVLHAVTKFDVLLRAVYSPSANSPHSEDQRIS